MKYYYDLHVHSCLSPCGDEDSTPNSIAGIASLSGLNIVALTDHNTTKNCAAFFEAASRYGIVPVAGMEFTTSEDIHVVCLFENLSDATRFDEELDEYRAPIMNKPSIFGEQLIMDSCDNVIGSIDELLITASTLSIEEIIPRVERHDGVCYPAHIDRASNSITAILGAIPKEYGFRFFEIHDKLQTDELCKRHGINKENIIISSDAHYLTDIRDGENYLELDAPVDSPDAVREKLFELLRGKL